jgi:bacillopeptidase F (M6 metalloprotease family)
VELETGATLVEGWLVALCFIPFFLTAYKQIIILFKVTINRGADKSLAQHTSRCISFDGENISFDASLVKYINSTNIPQIMNINRIYETQNLLSL